MIYFLSYSALRVRVAIFLFSSVSESTSNSDGESNPWQETERDFSDQRLNVGDAMLLAFDLHKNSTLVELK